MFRFFDRLAAQFKAAQDAQQVLRHVTREAVEALESEAGCIAVSHDDASGARLLFAVPRASTWDLDLLARFIRVERPTRPDDLPLAPIARRRAEAAALAFVRPGRPFDRQDKRLLARVADITSDAVQQSIASACSRFAIASTARSASSCIRRTSSTRFSTASAR